MIRGDISVRSLAEFVCRSGDLYARQPGRRIDPEEGIAHQRDAQRLREAEQENYAREVAVAATFCCGSGSRELKGRMDGLAILEEEVIVEEYKCCGALPTQAALVDTGQAWLYAGLYANSNPEVEHVTINVIYIEADSSEQCCFTDRVASGTALAFLQLALLCYVTRIETHLARNADRHDWAETLKFPLPQYRPAQQAIARRVYRALDVGENLLLEAPTGSGKTIGVLYPAIKAQKLDDQIFYLTSRNAGARAALATAHQLDPHGSQLCVVELTAKEKTCFVEGMPCDAELCPYAAGYFDRIAGAVSELLDDKYADRAKVEEVAEQHQVCPFELSLDTALWADLIVGDFNYVFDPMVKLQRFADHKRLHLLVDEAHQLSPRVRDMLAVKLDRKMIQRAKKGTNSEINKRIASIDRALLSMRRTHGQGEHVLDGVTSLTRACNRLLEVVAATELELSADPAVQEVYFAASRWIRSETWYQPEHFVHLVKIEGRDVEVSRVCLDAGPYLTSVYQAHAGVVRFSGTVSPLTLYQRLHGQVDAQAERAQNPFASNQALVLLVHDVPTYYKQRSASLTQLVDMILDLTGAQRGKYLVALPSYSYLALLADAYPQGDYQLFAQTQGQGNEATDQQLAEFADCDAAILFIVMGGIYGESVDFSDTNLSGVIMVGLGLPPPSLERNLLQAHFEAEAGAGWGRMVAYTQPALVKNIQAAGRLIRSPTDFGVICLVDPRFGSNQVQRFFPSHWQPQMTAAAQVKGKATKFWLDKNTHEESSSL